MNGDEQLFRKFPILRELFSQWRDVRGVASPGDFQKPYSRDWEALISDAGLTSAESRREADRDARLLADSGLIRLKTVKFRPYEIERIQVPFDAEPRLRLIFADEMPPPPDPKFDPAKICWSPEMHFVQQLKSAVAPEDLVRLNEFFLNAGVKRPMIPIKERSLQVFGDEKRLDALRSTILFKGHLTLDLLRCFIAAEPLGWQRGANATAPILVIENAATWDSYCRWNLKHGHFAAVVYGCGNRFADSVTRLKDIFSEIGGPNKVLYFGDLDPQGLRIPQQASYAARAAGMPPIEPDNWSYRKLLTLGKGHESAWESSDPLAESELEWLGELADPVRSILNQGKRIAQEHVSWEFLGQTNQR